MSESSSVPCATSRASATQLQIHALELRHPGQPVANLPVALHLDGPLDAALLARALNTIVARHDILRTRFELRDGQPVPFVTPALNVPVPVIDLRLLPDGVRDAQAFRLAQEEASRPFEAQRVPLLRTQLFIFEETRRILVLTFHRAIFDHDSLALLLPELAETYDALHRGETPAATPARRQYAELAAHAAESARQRDTAWWDARLSDAPAPLHLCADRPHRPHGSGHCEKHDLPAALRDAVESLARREGTNPFTIFLTVFTVLLHRYSGAHDLVFGLTLSDRPVTTDEPVLGPFTRITPFRATLGENPSFNRLLARLRTEVLDVFAHAGAAPITPAQDCPVGFSYDRRLADPVSWPGLRVQELALTPGACPCELSFHVVENAGALSVCAEYNPAVFSPAIVQRLLGHYGVLLAAALARPTTRLAALPLLTPLEERRLLGEWNNTQSGFPRDATVHELISARAELTPDPLAVAPGLTYRELERRSNQLGRHLRARGVHAGTRVALCADRPADIVISALGILKAGGCVLPLDPGAPAACHARLLAETRTELVLTTLMRRDHLPRVLPILLLDAEAHDLHHADDAQLAIVNSPDDPAWIAVSAGSGGPPRPVEFSHRALVSLLHAIQQNVRLAPEDLLLATAKLSSAAALTDLLLPLLFGSRVDLPTPTELARPLQLAMRALISKPTVMLATPTQWRQLLDAGWTGSSCLRLFSRGEPLSRELADRLLACGTSLTNFYGTVETGGVCLASPVSTDRPATLAGRPVANVQVHLLDAQLLPVPVGLAGELFVGGDTLATRYCRTSATAAAQFVTDPFRRQPGARLFRTGDRARRLETGEIEILPRIERAPVKKPVAPALRPAPVPIAPPAPAATPAAPRADSAIPFAAAVTADVRLAT